MALLTESDLDFNGIPVRVWRGGSGRPILMLHGSGAGASTMGNFRKVLEPLAERYTLLAADLIGFGKSGGKRVEPYFDMDMWVNQADFLARQLSSGPVGFIGHSLASPIGLKLEARTGRIDRFLATGTMGTSFQAEATGRGWLFPEGREALERFMAGSVFDKACIEKQDVDYREVILNKPGYGDYFRKMFELPRQHYIDASVVTPQELAKVKSEVLFVHGANDTSWPLEKTAMVLAKTLTQADIHMFHRCGHGVAYEQPEKFLASCRQFFG